VSERLFLVANVSDRVSRRIDRDYGTSAVEVRRHLESLQIPGEVPGERVVAAIVLSGGGDWDRFAAAIENARLDWRDVLVGAGLANDDWPEILDYQFGVREDHS
jgi:hypothetical protein